MTEEMKKRIHSMANRTWQAIGSDVLEINNGKDMPQKDVVEVVCDADYMKTYGNDPEAYAEWKKLYYAKQTEIISKAFPHARYGY
jgi:hypothetical protein